MGVRATVGCVLVIGALGALGACGTAEDASTTSTVPGPASTTPPVSNEDPAVEPPDFAPVPLADIGLSVPSDCPTPWLPLYAQDETTAPASVPPTEVRPSGGTPIPDLAELRFRVPDTDGDGTADEPLTSVDNGAAFAMSRGDGELVLAVPGGSVGSPGGASWAGDLDGDGRDELLVYVADGSGEVDHPLYVVPGATPAGRHDPRDVGVRLPAFAGMPAAPLGDVDGDGNQDLLLPRSADQLMVVSGTIIMDAVGGAVPRDVQPLVALPADVRGTLLLGDARTVPIRVRPVDGDPAATELVLITEPPLVLRTDRQPLAVAVAANGAITGFDNDGGRHVQLAMPGTRSGTQLVFVWNLDEPCAGPTPAG